MFSYKLRGYRGDAPGRLDLLGLGLALVELLLALAKAERAPLLRERLREVHLHLVFGVRVWGVGFEG